METKHTPGPWKASGTGINGAASSYGHRWRVATCTDSYWDGSDLTGEAQANARLIASAPDLLKLAQNLLEYFDHKNEIHSPHTLHRMATQAINKALGLEGKE